MNPICNQQPYSDFLAPKTEETRITYARILAMIRRELRMEVHQASENDLIAFFLELRKRGVKVTTQQTYKATLCSFFKHLAITKKRVSNPMLVVCEEIKTANKDKTVRKALTAAQRKQVLDALDWQGDIHAYQMSLAILFGFKCGFRRFEIAKVQWEDIDFTDGTITVLGKGAKKATVPLSKMMIEKLQDFRMIVDKAGIDTRWVFFIKDSPHKHLTKFSIGHYYKVIKKRVGFGDEILFSSHDGRRVFCTTLHEKEVDDLTAIKMSRHESVDMFKRYVRIDDEKIKGELNRAIE